MIEAISHRGSRAGHVENTIEAVLAAVEEGADGVEIDVHASSDGTVVVHHDFFPRGHAPDRRLNSRPIADLTYAELQQFDLGGGARMPALSGLMSALGDSAKLYVEIKGQCDAQLADLLRAGASSVAVHSFDHRAIKRMATRASDIPRGVLQGSYTTDNCVALESASARDLWQQFELIDRDLVQEVHGCGGRVIAWTANEERDWDRLAAAGVDAICTDRLDRFTKWRSRA